MRLFAVKHELERKEKILVIVDGRQKRKTAVLYSITVIMTQNRSKHSLTSNYRAHAAELCRRGRGVWVRAVIRTVDSVEYLRLFYFFYTFSEVLFLRTPPSLGIRSEMLVKEIIFSKSITIVRDFYFHLALRFALFLLLEDAREYN